MPFPSRFWKGGRKPYHTWARYSPVNSQVSSASSATAGFAYDQAGNVIFYGLNNYWYNAEGQTTPRTWTCPRGPRKSTCAVQQSGTITAYTYDAGAGQPHPIDNRNTLPRYSSKAGIYPPTNRQLSPTCSANLASSASLSTPQISPPSHKPNKPNHIHPSEYRPTRACN